MYSWIHSHTTFLAFELRRKLYRSALKEKPSKENSRLRRYNQNSEKRQSVINCFQDLLGRSPAIASNVSQFMERLVNGLHRFFAFISENEKDPLAYSLLLDIYNRQCVSSSTASSAFYMSYDTTQSVLSLWKKIFRNGTFLHPFSPRNRSPIRFLEHSTRSRIAKRRSPPHYPPIPRLSNRGSGNRRQQSLLHAHGRVHPDRQFLVGFPSRRSAFSSTATSASSTSWRAWCSTSWTRPVRI